MIDRDWSAARWKVEREGRCRVCRAKGVQAAHVVARKFDERIDKDHWRVRPEDVVPLCIRCHEAYDKHELDLLPHLTHEEQGAAAGHIGLFSAIRRTSGRAAAFK